MFASGEPSFYFVIRVVLFMRAGGEDCRISSECDFNFRVVHEGRERDGAAGA
jgi:hypothetical protein